MIFFIFLPLFLVCFGGLSVLYGRVYFGSGLYIRLILLLSFEIDMHEKLEDFLLKHFSVLFLHWFVLVTVCVCGADINGDVHIFLFQHKLIYNNLGLVFIMRIFKIDEQHFPINNNEYSILWIFHHCFASFSQI